MRREPGSSRPQGEIRDVLASSSCVISQICEYEMTLPCGETQNRLKFKLDKSFQQRREREARDISRLLALISWPALAHTPDWR